MKDENGNEIPSTDPATPAVEGADDNSSAGGATPPPSPEPVNDDKGHRITEFYDGNAEEFDVTLGPKSKTPGVVVTKYVITTRSNERIWLRTKPAETHNNVSYTKTSEGYCNNATTSRKVDTSTLAQLNKAVQSAKSSNYDANKDRLDAAPDKSAAATMLDFDAVKLLDYV